MIRSLRFYSRVAAAGAGFLAACAKGTALALTRRDRSAVPMQTARAVARWMGRPLGVEVRLQGEEILSAAQPCVYVCNHQSMFDLAVLGEFYPGNTVVVGKHELRRVPFFGWVFGATGNIWLDRSDTEGSVHRLKGAEQAIREQGVSVWLFPEGTRGTRTGEMLPFKKGAFRMAIDTGVPIVPVVVSPIGPLFDPSQRLLRPGAIAVEVLEPEPTTGLTPEDTESLRDRVRERMRSALRTIETTPR